ncbi:CDGSH iron-sulfur domain-containing protein [Meiothermus sp.]|uniref:CDGSH iron-sulfur domain-containing protein n=1 Tax=Meiothermus sp. TaxID=1955249 RepID=UPI0021DC5CCD|nr:CDGSH iron-sulfur domain-containing protein [Meiothermus sp.]GIW33467.1 MAG: iron-binding protein [Meiothermus sp.]
MKIRLRENGSLVLDLPEGTKFVLNGEERVLERAKLALCRCGHSENKPFCDGSHKRVGFEAAAGEIELVSVVLTPESGEEL